LNEKRPRGRPHSARLEADLIEAALQLLEEKRSFDAVSIDAVCAHVGASKASFYRRWPTREHFVLAILQSLRPSPLAAGPTASLRSDLVEILTSIFGFDVRRTRIAHSALVAQGRKSPELMTMIFRDLVAPRRKAVLDRIRRGVADGDLAADTDITALYEIITAPILKVMMLTDPDQPVPHNIAGRVVDQALRGALAKR